LQVYQVEKAWKQDQIASRARIDTLTEMLKQLQTEKLEAEEGLGSQRRLAQDQTRLHEAAKESEKKLQSALKACETQLAALQVSKSGLAEAKMEAEKALKREQRSKDKLLGDVKDKEEAIQRHAEQEEERRNEIRLDRDRQAELKKVKEWLTAANAATQKAKASEKKAWSELRQAKSAQARASLHEAEVSTQHGEVAALNAEVKRGEAEARVAQEEASMQGKKLLESQRMLEDARQEVAKAQVVAAGLRGEMNQAQEEAEVSFSRPHLVSGPFA